MILLKYQSIRVKIKNINGLNFDSLIFPLRLCNLCGQVVFLLGKVEIDVQKNSLNLVREFALGDNALWPLRGHRPGSKGRRESSPSGEDKVRN